MYSGQFLEMFSQSVHTQNLADAERKRFASTPADESLTDRTSLMEMIRRQLGRIAPGERTSRSSSLRAASQPTSSR
jgi:hypothetical protein